jgi:DNA gyrase/topoisomerase IV subunit A
MNVLIKGKVPKVIGLAEALREWLDHRRDVLLRRSEFPAEADRQPAGSARRLSDRVPATSTASSRSSAARTSRSRC